MAEVVLFGGTSDSRHLALLLSELRVSTLVSCATSYGGQAQEEDQYIRVRTKRLDAEAMKAMLLQEKARLVIDATHPYARLVGEQIRACCDSLGLPLLRLVRDQSGGEDVLSFETLDELCCWLSQQKGVVFSALGAKEAERLSRVEGARERIWLRILPFADSLTRCLELGFPPAHLICMQGPFSAELNKAMFRASGADILITKDSGSAGGFAEKLAAARECGMTVAVWARQAEDKGMSLEEMKAWLRKEFM